MRRSWEIERIATKQRELDVTENPEMDEATRQEAMRRIEQERHQADQQAHMQ
jgi:colicin import membrane protein